MASNPKDTSYTLQTGFFLKLSTMVDSLGYLQDRRHAERCLGFKFPILIPTLRWLVKPWDIQDSNDNINSCINLLNLFESWIETHQAIRYHIQSQISDINICQRCKQVCILFQCCHGKFFQNEKSRKLFLDCQLYIIRYQLTCSTLCFSMPFSIYSYIRKTITYNCTSCHLKSAYVTYSIC